MSKPSDEEVARALHDRMAHDYVHGGPFDFFVIKDDDLTDACVDGHGDLVELVRFVRAHG